MTHAVSLTSVAAQKRPSMSCFCVRKGKANAEDSSGVSSVQGDPARSAPKPSRPGETAYGVLGNTETKRS